MITVLYKRMIHISVKGDKIIFVSYDRMTVRIPEDKSFFFFKGLQVVMTRVTRLGNFLPIGGLFSLGIVLKLTEVAQFFGYLFSRYQLCIIIDKKMLSGIFKNSSGHSGIWLA
jgi:hypothetical protein